MRALTGPSPAQPGARLSAARRGSPQNTPPEPARRHSACVAEHGAQSTPPQAASTTQVGLAQG
eukprot:443967-Prymnesium_polylepis.1